MFFLVWFPAIVSFVLLAMCRILDLFPRRTFWWHLAAYAAFFAMQFYGPNAIVSTTGLVLQAVLGMTLVLRFRLGVA